MEKLLSEAKDHGAQLLLDCPFIRGEATPTGIVLTIGREQKKLVCKTVINAAGLKAQEVARALSGIPPEKIPETYFAKGQYFTLKFPSPFTHLIYPVPVPGGLGIHATLDLHNQVRFGPDVSWVDDIDYSPDPSREGFFYEAIRRYYPSLPDDSLEVGTTGIRPKIVPEGSPDHDFVIQGPREHGVGGLVNLFGIESPGFTSSLAIAEEVEKMLAMGPFPV